MEQFTAGSVIKSGWETFKKRPFFIIGATVLFAVMSAVFGTLSDIVGQGDAASELVAFLVDFLLSTFVGIGMTAFFLKAAQTVESVRLGDIWHPQNYLRYLGASILQGAVVVIGLVLLIVPGVIFALMFLFTPYIVVDKGLGPIAAMKESARITRGMKWELFLLMLLMLVLNLVGALLLLVGLLVTIPVSLLAIVGAYRLLQAKAGAPAAAAPATPTPAAV